MTNNRSSFDAFLLFINQAKQKSSLLKVSGYAGAIDTLDVVCRVATVGSSGFSVRGRGCELAFSFEGASFDSLVLRDLPIVALRPDDPEALFRPLWEVKWKDGTTLFFGEHKTSE